MGKFCSHCGKETIEGATYCMGCGFAIEQPREVKKNNPSNLSLIISIVGLVVGVIGFLYALLAFKALGTGIEYIKNATDLTEVLGYTFGFILVQGLLTVISFAINNSVKKMESNKPIINATSGLNIIAICAIVLQALILIFEF